jgi:L-ascorbate metabolism protein UlaG (beta-lactamase superfamily)
MLKDPFGAFKKGGELKMKLQWLGHACFLITSDSGLRILTDPYNEQVGYDLPAVEAEIVLTSHDHFDHANVKVVKGSPDLVKAPGTHAHKGVVFKGTSTYHDQSKGSERGANIVFSFEVDGVKLCHLGDLGHVLTEAEAQQIGPVDLLMIPVGGFYTIDKEQANKVIEVLKPKIAIPMHVKNDKCKFPIGTVDEFLAINKDKKITKHSDSTMEINADSLPSALEIHILRHAL